MKFRTTLVLLVLVLGLGTFFYLYTSRQPTVREYKEQQSQVFPAREFEDPRSPFRHGIADLVTKLELRDSSSRIELERSNEAGKSEWGILKPIRAAADSGSVSSILSELEFMKAAQKLTGGKERPLDLKSWGLDPPERSITFGFGEKSWTLNIGAKTADGKSAYVARMDAPAVVCIVPESVIAKASERVNDLRDKAALRFDKSAVTRVDLVPAEGPALELRKDAGGPLDVAQGRPEQGRTGGWRLVRGVEDEAGADAVTKLLDAVAALRVDAGDFLADDVRRAAEFGLDKPRFKLSVFEGDAARTLVIGADDKDDPKKCYARREGDPTLFAVEKTGAEALMKSAADLRAKTALQFDPDQVATITLAVASAPSGAPAQTVRLAQSSGVWKFEEPSGAAADPEQVKRFLDDLHNLEVRDWVDAPTAGRLAETGLTAPRITITLTTKSGASSALRFGKPAEKPELCYGRRNEQGPILILPGDLASRLAVGYLAFVSRKVLEFNKDDAVAVRIVRPGGVVALERKGDKWMLGDPAAAGKPAAVEADGARVDDLLWALSFLEAKWVAAEKAKSLAEYGLDAPRIRAILAMKSAAPPKPEAPAKPAPPGKPSTGPAAEPAKAITLLVGKELPDGGSYAMMEGGDRIFVIAKAPVEHLMADFVKAKPAPEPPPKSGEAPKAPPPGKSDASDKAAKSEPPKKALERP